MEKVKVVKPIAGILKTGDILISPVDGADFCLEEVNVTSRGSNERFISLDYVTVSENVPYFFEFLEKEDEEPTIELDDDCDCACCTEFARTRDEVNARYDFFSEKYNESPVGSEAQVVYKNLMWFIEWLYGQKEVI